MQLIFSVSLAIYFIFYTFEGAIRYGLHFLDGDVLIFARDIILALPLAGIFVLQFLRRQVHPAYKIFLFIITLHGIIMLLNIGSGIAVIYGIKILMTGLAGALAAPLLCKPGRFFLMLFLFLWAVTLIGVVLDKFFISFPWVGIQATIGDLHVDVGRDWQVTGENKRASGFMRSSIFVAILEPLLALVLLFNLRSFLLRMAIALATIPILYWTTQKGAILAYVFVLALIAMAPKRPALFLRSGIVIALIIAIAPPVILPGYHMPNTSGVFSFSSFYLRIEETWPKGWQWIERHEVFPFGVGLGGISGPQRLYAPAEVNYSDNMFILLYAYFGLMTFVYLGWPVSMAMRLNSDVSPAAVTALALLVFLFSYGAVINVIEDQMGSMFLGAAVTILAQELKRQGQNSDLPMENMVTA